MAQSCMLNFEILFFSFLSKIQKNHIYNYSPILRVRKKQAMRLLKQLRILTVSLRQHLDKTTIWEGLLYNLSVHPISQVQVKGYVSF